MQVICLKNICKSFGSTQALDSVSLEIASGKRLVLIGGSGAGKTTLLRVLAGLESSDSGRVFIGEEDVTSKPAHQRGIAYLSQDYAVYPQLSVLRNLSVALEPLKLSKSESAERIELAMQWFELGALADRRPAQLSGGQLQRVALAKALVRRPRVLVLDEPFSQLDPALREQSRQLILATTEKFAMTLVMVTHDPLDAMRLADQLAVLERGKLVQFGNPQEVYRLPNSRMVAELLSPFGINDLEFIQQPADSIRKIAGANPEIKTQKILFRPEVATICLEQKKEQPNTEIDTLHFEGQVIETRTLGFGTLVLVEVKMDVTDSDPQRVKILLPFGAEVPTGAVLFRVARINVLNLPPG